VAVLKTNYANAAPGFVNRANYDLHPTANAQVIDAGSAPGNSASGFALAPTAQYVHVAGSQARPVSGALDIGAYEAATASTTPAPTPTPTPAPTTWTPCAAEGGTCSFSGTQQVRYGANNSYVTKTFTGSAVCNNSNFGDPAPGYAKSCAISGTPTTTSPTPTPVPTPAPATWTNCSGENGTCSFSGTRQVRYGANNSYSTKTFIGAASCNNGTFGDPAPGYVKSCSYSSVTQ
jgi:hypothetical protein